MKSSSILRKTAPGGAGFNFSQWLGAEPLSPPLGGGESDLAAERGPSLPQSSWPELTSGGGKKQGSETSSLSPSSVSVHSEYTPPSLPTYPPALFFLSFQVPGRGGEAAVADRVEPCRDGVNNKYLHQLYEKD